MATFASLNRRYLRISQNRVLEVRIYLHPELIPTFTDGLLDKLIASVRPIIIPKLKEENAKKNDKRPTRDRISEPEFDASVFLLPVTTRHVVLNRTREFSFHGKEEDEKPALNTTYTGFSIYGRALCLVLEPPTGNTPAPSARKKKVKNVLGGIEDWFVNQQREEPGIDDA